MMFNKNDNHLKNNYYQKIVEHNNSIITEGALSTNLTGAKYTIWLDPVGKNRNVQHNLARVKVQIDKQLYPVIIDGDIRIGNGVNISNKIKRQIESCFDVIRANKNLFLYYWEHPETDFNYIKSKVKNIKNLRKEE